MKGMELRLVGAQVLTPFGFADTPLSMIEGLIVGDCPAREVDLHGFLVLPGIVDAHGDGFERHLAARRGAMKELDQGLIAAEAELAANGITTATLAQFYSWEGGMRGPEFAERMFGAMAKARPHVMTDLRAQLRFETSLLEDYDAVEDMVVRHEVSYVVFNDHLPHEALAAGKRPPRLTGQALRIGRSPEKHLEHLQALHGRLDAVPGAVARLSTSLRALGVMLGSHDDRSADQRRDWRARGVCISEFPETVEAAKEARKGGDAVIMGAPNVVRGGSHKDNVSATYLATMGYCDALASDYHYPSLLRAALLLADCGAMDIKDAWALVSSGPARVLGLTDRGELSPGKRADLVVLDAKTRAVTATIADGKISYMSGEAAARFMG